MVRRKPGDKPTSLSSSEDETSLPPDEEITSSVSSLSSLRFECNLVRLFSVFGYICYVGYFFLAQ